MTKRGLGRGLEVLIPVEDEPPRGLQDVPVEAIVPNPHQPRMPILEQDLHELADSIREHGILQPLVVTHTADGHYQLIAGERRWRAARLAGLQRVPVIVKDVAPQQMLELALVENVQRADLNPIEEALAYKHLVEEFGLAQGEVARRVGKSRPAVANTLRLLLASTAVQEALMDGTITEGHARALLGLPRQEDQDAVLKVILKQGLNVRQVESLVQQFGRHKKSQAAPWPEIHALEERFEASLGTRVRLKTGRKGGQVTIYYYSNEEFQALYERLTGERLED
ncbi:MAG TPA: ParB/RepB/Spo0J family partition protein [Anaerolineae bacterium]|nr:ParB/RepB/Spo0J family partition protein [Anaerolineae bacterium]HQH37366.1 ParB/RepB/Spo0J family partition protein [Anaerolineae bacterium]